MPLDPVTATAIGATAKWLWDNYGKDSVSFLVKLPHYRERVGIASVPKVDEKESFQKRNWVFSEKPSF